MDDNVKFLDDFENEKIDTSYGLIVFEVNAHATTIPHEHESSEVWIVLSGEGYASHSGIRINLSKDSQVTIPPNTEHSLTCVSEEPLKVLSMWWRKAS